MHKSQSGSAIIEGLTALTIFSLGVLGLIGLQARVLENNANSQLRAEASYMSQELVGLATADYINAPCYTVNPAAANCTDAAAAAAAADWAARVQAAFPGAAITAPSATYAADGTFTVTIQWKRDNDDMWHNYVTTTNIQMGS
jgi:type IV pilus assembly protein PilV